MITGNVSGQPVKRVTLPGVNAQWDLFAALWESSHKQSLFDIKETDLISTCEIARRWACDNVRIQKAGFYKISEICQPA